MQTQTGKRVGARGCGYTGAACSLTLIFLGAGVISCSSSETIVARFCKRHTQREFGMAYGMLSTVDRDEVSEKEYGDFDWDQQTFDMRILRSSDLCGAEVKKLSDTQALGTMVLTSHLHDREFRCVVPLVKEGSSWTVTRHWEPVETYIRAVATARQGIVTTFKRLQKLDGAEYTAAAKKAMADYWTRIDGPKKAVADDVGGVVPRFCHGPLNVDGGRDLVYDYLGFQEQKKVQKKPKQLIAAAKKYGKVVEQLRAGYAPAVSVKQKGTRVDLVASRVGDGSDDLTPDEVRSLLVVWGEIKPPLFWNLDVFSKGKQTNEGKGSPLEVVTDMQKYAPEAPPLAVALFDFPKMPAGTDRLELVFTDSDSPTEYTISIPVRPEFLEAK